MNAFYNNRYSLYLGGKNEKNFGNRCFNYYVDVWSKCFKS